MRDSNIIWKLRERSLSETTERGNILIISLYLLIVLFAFMGLVWDVGMAYVMKTSMTTTVNVMRDSNLDLAILTRNSPHPGADVAENLTNVARANGFDGQVEVSYYELTPLQLDASGLTGYSKRVWVIDIVLKDDYDTVFMCLFDPMYNLVDGGQGLKKLNLQVETVTGDTNESGNYVWFPTKFINGAQDYNGKWITPPGVAFSDRELVRDQPDNVFGSGNFTNTSEMSEAYIDAINSFCDPDSAGI